MGLLEWDSADFYFEGLSVNTMWGSFINTFQYKYRDESEYVSQSLLMRVCGCLSAFLMLMTDVLTPPFALMKGTRDWSITPVFSEMYSLPFHLCSSVWLSLCLPVSSVCPPLLVCYSVHFYPGLTICLSVCFLICVSLGQSVTKCVHLSLHLSL